MVQSAEVDVVGPAVAAYGPYRFYGEHVGTLEQLGILRGGVAHRTEHRHELRGCRGRKLGVVLGVIPCLKRCLEIGHGLVGVNHVAHHHLDACAPLLH